MIYMDNGATSFPKPPEVLEAFIDCAANYCANPGRSGHFAAARTAQEIFKVRLAAAQLFNIDNAGRIIFTKNCTEALNIAIKGILREGDHVVTSSMEHNSVIRPLYELRKKRIHTTVVPCDADGFLNPEHIKRALTANTKLIVLTAASNVTGTKMPLEEVGRIALRNGIVFMVDGAQGAGHMSIDVKRMGIDILAVPGHKGLLGLQGSGMLYVRDDIDIDPLISGGTGNLSKELSQPAEFPEGFEAGTLNSPGIIALGAAIKMLNKIGIDVIEEYERRLTERLQRGLENIEGVRFYGPSDSHCKTAVTAMNITGVNCEETALLLNDEFGIAVRAGFHCSPLAHKTIGTYNCGCVRICPGFYTTEKEIDEVIEAVRSIAARYQ